MARCLECHREIKLSLDEITDPVFCPSCHRGPFKVKRSSGYIFALGFVLYFIFVVVFGGMILGIAPSTLFVHAHFPSKNTTFASVFFLVGFFVWVKVWTGIWSKKYAKFKR